MGESMEVRGAAAPTALKELSRGDDPGLMERPERAYWKGEGGD